MKQRTKNIVLVIGFLFLGIIAYTFSISKTLALKKELALIEKQALSQENLSQKLSNLKAREMFCDSILSKNNLKNTSIQNTLLDLLNKHAINSTVQITSFLEPHKSNHETTIETSFRFTLRGSYKSIEAVLYALEQELSIGKITHVNFSKKRDFRKGLNYLECDVIVGSFM